MNMPEAVALDEPKTTADEYGRTLGWDQRFEARANFRYLRGGETVQAARLEGRQVVVVTIRQHAKSQAITSAWRMRDTRRGITYNVRSVVPTDDRRFLELTCETAPT